VFSQVSAWQALILGLSFLLLLRGDGVTDQQIGVKKVGQGSSILIGSLRYILSATSPLHPTLLACTVVARRLRRRYQRFLLRLVDLPTSVDDISLLFGPAHVDDKVFHHLLLRSKSLDPLILEPQQLALPSIPVILTILVIPQDEDVAVIFFDNWAEALDVIAVRQVLRNLGVEVSGQV
jgi:hypothetical protein